MMHFGRPVQKNEKEARETSERSENGYLHGAAGRVLALGAAMVAGFFVAVTAEWPESPMPAEAVAVFSTAVTGEQEEVRAPVAGEAGEAAGTGSEPFGYLDGEWNVWEYIGDLVWSLLS